jgi:hypothetical protein
VVMGMPCLLGVLQVLPCLSAAGVTTTMVAGPSSSGAEDAESPAKKALLWSFLLVSSRYGFVHWFARLPFLQLLFYLWKVVLG